MVCGIMAISNIKPIPRASGVHYNRQKGQTTWQVSRRLKSGKMLPGTSSGLCSTLPGAGERGAAQQPLPRPALVEAARQAFPFAPTYDPHAFGERSLADLYVYLQAYNHHIADIFPDAPTALYPERATPAGLQFLIRWMF